MKITVRILAIATLLLSFLFNMNLVKVIVFCGMCNYASGIEPFTTFAAIGSLFASPWNYCQSYKCCRTHDIDTSGKVFFISLSAVYQ